MSVPKNRDSDNLVAILYLRYYDQMRLGRASAYFIWCMCIVKAVGSELVWTSGCLACKPGHADHKIADGPYNYRILWQCSPENSWTLNGKS